MTTYIGHFGINGTVYDVVVTPNPDKRNPTQHEIKYRKSKSRIPDNRLDEVSSMVSISEEFGWMSNGQVPYRVGKVIPNGNGKGKLEKKVENFLRTIR